jgi:hypothetical protein
VARSATVSTTSKFFLQLSHMNSYLGMSSTAVSNSPRVPSEERLDRSSLGNYPRMTSFLTLARSDTKDSTSFLIAAFFCVRQPVGQEAFIARLRPRSTRAAGALATDRHRYRRSPRPQFSRRAARWLVRLTSDGDAVRFACRDTLRDGLLFRGRSSRRSRQLQFEANQLFKPDLPATRKL